jgi:hypothetical protein
MALRIPPNKGRIISVVRRRYLLFICDPAFDVSQHVWGVVHLGVARGMGPSLDFFGCSLCLKLCVCAITGVGTDLYRNCKRPGNPEKREKREN